MKPALFSLILTLTWGCGLGKSHQTSQLKWDAESVDNETRNTHLWIVNRALDILGSHPELDTANTVFQRLNEPTCRTAWQQGLIDADFLAKYNGGMSDLPIPASTLQIASAQSSWKSHFYDPESGLNYDGQADPTAFTQTMLFAAAGAPIEVETGAFNETSPCYNTGLSLHYFTDLTQPMHAANFTALSRPRGLHSNIEGHAMTLQGRVQLNDWTAIPSDSLSAFVQSVALESKAEWTEMLESISNAYTRSSDSNPITCGDLAEASNIFLTQEFDHPTCWNHDDEVNATISRSLENALDRTAQFLFLLARWQAGL